MRLTLIDLLIWVALLLIGAAIVRWAIPAGRLSAPVFVILQAGGAIVVYTVIASLLYRILFWPLSPPRCPHCRKRPSSIEIAGTWPLFVVVCGACAGRAELRMDDVDNAAGDLTLPALQLKWPYFLGRYTRIR